MTKNFPLLQLTLVLGLGLAASGCETFSDAANGVGNAVSNVASDLNPFPSDAPVQTADNDAPPTTSADANANTSPDLSNLPARPTTSTPAQQQAAAQSLAADGAQARYSADALRAGTEAAAAPPSAADVPPSAQVALNAPPSAAPQSAAAPSAQAPVAAAPPPSAPSPALSQGTGAVPAAGAAAPVRTAALPSTAAAAIPPGAEPAVPANAPVRRGSAMAMGSARYTSDAALGFKPSSAPPLSPSINQWVAAPIVARYRQTASNAGVSSSSMAAVPAKGTPISADGALMANMDAVSMGPSNSIAAMNGGVAPTAVIYFPGDGSTLSPAARTLIRNAVAQYKAAGGEASVRVVGHASSRTANMPVEKHLEVIFDKSQSRANAVAQELIREGIPAAKVLVDAVGDSQPVYYESMPQGENGNRRAEIFVQG